MSGISPQERKAPKVDPVTTTEPALSADRQAQFNELAKNRTGRVIGTEDGATNANQSSPIRSSTRLEMECPLRVIDGVERMSGRPPRTANPDESPEEIKLFGSGRPRKSAGAGCRQ